MQQQYGQQLAHMQSVAMPIPLPYIQGAPQQSKRCACKKARCLKLYCVCFAAGVCNRT